MATNLPCVLIEGPGLTYQQWNQPMLSGLEDDQELDPRVVIDFTLDSIRYLQHEARTTATHSTVAYDLHCISTDTAFAKVESTIDLLRLLPSKNIGFIRRSFLKHVGEAIAGYSFLQGMAELRIRVQVSHQSLQEDQEVN